MSVTLVVAFIIAIIVYFVTKCDDTEGVAKSEQKKDEQYKQEAQDILKHQNTIELQAANKPKDDDESRIEKSYDDSRTNTLAPVVIEDNSLLVKDEGNAQTYLTNRPPENKIIEDDVLGGTIGVRTSLGILRPAPAPAQTDREGTLPSHRRKRSQYYEAEIHSSEATVESDDRPSQRLQGSVALIESVGKKSMFHKSI